VLKFTLFVGASYKFNPLYGLGIRVRKGQIFDREALQITGSVMMVGRKVMVSLDLQCSYVPVY
jgi:hypothetical protein